MHRLRLNALALICVVLTGCGGSGSGSSNELTITPSSLAGGTTGATYGASLTATGGSRSGYLWDVESGQFPPGLLGMPATGATAQISGTLGAPGTYIFRLRLRDDQSGSVSVSYTLVITESGGGGGGGGGGQDNRPTSLVGAPIGRTGHTAVWTGTEMLIWGGFHRLSLLGDGGAYDPSTDSWRALSTVNEPAARQQHTAVWTGTEMIIWGGFANTGELGTGGAYNPTTDTWRALSTTNAPQARSGFSAVWTGSSMVVYGGSGLAPPPAPNGTIQVLGNGGIYDPITDMWTAPALGPPVFTHSVVWSGTQMITWGGLSSLGAGFQILNTGGMYSATGDTWSFTPQAGAPSARVQHSAVWTGASGMLVWGGTGDTANFVATGAKLDPTTNQWTPTSTVGAPSARGYHTMVWTGTEAVVWGGGTNLVIASDGGVYNPVTNVWRPLAAGFTPSVRRAHTAVWTGTAMIVWGGEDVVRADVYLNDGAILHP